MASKHKSVFASPDEKLGGIFARVEPLHGDDATIDAVLADAELPALLATLSVLMDDPSLIPDELVPPTPPMGVTIVAQGGMTSLQQEKARRLAKNALVKARDHGWSTLVPSEASLKSALRYVTNTVSEADCQLLLRELGLPGDKRRPNWRKEEVAPGREFSVIVVGAGLSGIAAAYRLSQANIPFVVLEKNPDVGGVWWNNTYPGCRLDTPNFAYSYSFAAKADWPQQFSQRSEILRYAQDVLKETGLREKFRFSTEVDGMSYSEVDGQWTIKAREAGELKEYRANAVITATGQLNRPIIPIYEGSETFQGDIFHAGQWRDDVDLTDKRVAVVGTGASAFQIVPSVIDQVQSLHVFQRNPAWMLPTPNYHSDIKPGMRWLLKHVPYYGNWFRLWQFWIAAEGRRPAVVIDRSWKHPVSVSALNEEIRQGCLDSLSAQTDDRLDLFEKLKPSYAPGTKRMVRDNGAYVNALKQPKSHLITERIAKFTETGIETVDGTHHELDIVVYATGYKATEYLAPIKIAGADGQLLSDVWKDDCSAYLGITVPGFPNLFQLNGPNSSTVVNGNAINSMECTLEYTIGTIEYMLRHSLKQVDVRRDVLAAFVSEVDAANRECAWGDSRVETWYRSKTGRAIVPWPFTVFDFFERNLRFHPDQYVLTSL